MRNYDENLEDLLRLGLLSSEWGLTSGGRSRYYLDLDRILSRPDATKKVAEDYLGKIEKIQAEAGPIDRLAFIEKFSGPIGALSLKDLLVVKTDIPGVVIRLQRRILSAAVKGYSPLAVGERVLLISDVATSGRAILKAARIIWAFGARVPCALVFFDREQGAANNLQRVEIELHSLYSRSSPGLSEELFKLFDELPRAALYPSAASVTNIGSGY